MSRRPLDGEDFNRLLSAWADETLTSADWERFSTILAGSAEAREAYVQYATLHALLELAHLPPTEHETNPAGSPGSNEHGLWDRGPLPLISCPLPLVEGTDHVCSLPATAAPLAGAPGFWPLFSCRSPFFLGMLLLCGLTSFWIGSRLHNQVAQNREGQALSENQLAPPSSSDALRDSSTPKPTSASADAALPPGPSTTVARLIRVSNACWTNPQAVLQKSAALLAGQKIDLAAGEAEIKFRSGAVVILRGAAMLEIESPSSVRLLVGHVTARAETVAAHGFTVHTRTASMTDLGTEFEVQAGADGHSEVVVTAGSVELRSGNLQTMHRLQAGESAQIEPGERGVRAIIEPGDGTPAFKFPSIEPPSAKDYADSSQHHATVRVVRGKLSARSGPVELLLNGKGQSSHDSPGESVYFPNDVASGLILMDLHRDVDVQKINTYSWHQEWKNAPNRTRAPQKYFLYGSTGAEPPDIEGNLAANGWTLIARVNTDEYFFDAAKVLQRPAQQAVSITAAAGPIGRYRYLLWDVRPTPLPHPTTVMCVNTFYSEFDVYGE